MTVADETVRSRPGTVARCSCGWSSAWGIQDGSAEASAEAHRIANDPEYRRERSDRIAEHHAAKRERGCLCEHIADSYSYVVDKDCPMHGIRRTRTEPVEAGPVKFVAPCHPCSCHVDPPCNGCVECRHHDVDDCPNDCQTCEDHDEH